MRSFSLTFLTLLICVSSVSGYTDPEWDSYLDQKKNKGVAVGLAWVIPSAGHAYAGDWGRGIPFVLPEVALFFAVRSDPKMVEPTLGWIALGLFKLAELITAAQTVDKFNQELRIKYHIPEDGHRPNIFLKPVRPFSKSDPDFFPFWKVEIPLNS